MRKTIVLVDGSCGLCSRLTQFAAARDDSGQLRFSSLQSEAGKLLLGRQGMHSREESFVLLRGDQVYTKGRAAVELLGLLRGAALPAAMLRVVPDRLRDWGYALIARNRHLFQSRRSCSMTLLRTVMLESAEDVSRLLAEEDAG